MRLRIKTISIASAMLPLFTAIAAQAQSPQSFVQNEENQIQQDAGAGLINQKQNAKLQNQEAQIMQQEVQDANQNGGRLTHQERQQIDNETRNLNGNLNYDAQKNNPNMPYQPLNQWQNNNNHPRQYQNWGNNQSANWNPSWSNNPNYPYNPNNANNPNNPNFQQQQQNWQNNANGQQANMNGHHRHWRNYNNNQ